MVVFFCEKCKNLMTFKYEEDKTFLECCSCLGNIPIRNNNTINTVYVESKITNEYPIKLNTKYDRTLMRTRMYECKNEDCPSKNLLRHSEIRQHEKEFSHLAFSVAAQLH